MKTVPTSTIIGSSMQQSFWNLKILIVLRFAAIMFERWFPGWVWRCGGCYPTGWYTAAPCRSIWYNVRVPVLLFDLTVRERLQVRVRRRVVLPERTDVFAHIRRLCSGRENYAFYVNNVHPHNSISTLIPIAGLGHRFLYYADTMGKDPNLNLSQWKHVLRNTMQP